MGGELDARTDVHTPDWALEAPIWPEPVVDDVPLYAGGRAKRLARRRSVFRACGALLALVVVAGGGFVVTQRNKTGTVTLDEAVQRFRAEAEGAEPAPKAERAQAMPGVPDMGQASGDPRLERKPAAVAAPQAAAARGPYELPTAGVYAYRTTGGEQISVFGAKHEYPKRVFATVRHLGGCRWEHRNEVIEEHTDIRTFCSREKTFTQLAQERQVEFFGKRDGAEMRCTPALDVHTTTDDVGHTRRTTCTNGTDMHSDLVSKLVGIEEMRIDGAKVRAVHVHIAGTMSGRAEGTSSDDLWLSPDTGLTLRWVRTVDSVADAFGGAKVRYQEEASFLIESLEPKS